MKSIGAPRVAHRAGRYVASAVRHRGQLCTVVNPQGSTYRSGKVVQTNRATSQHTVLSQVTIHAWTAVNALTALEGVLYLHQQRFIGQSAL